MTVINKDNVVEQAEQLRARKAFIKYLGDYSVDYDYVQQRLGLDLCKEITTAEQAALFCKFCQLLWEDLPDSPSIRAGAFFDICDFAEYHCFGDEQPGADDEIKPALREVNAG